MTEVISPLDKIKATLRHSQTEEIPKGELWLGTDILETAGFEDTLPGHIRLTEQLRHDTICLPIAHEPFMNKTLGYRYFPVGVVREALKATRLFVMAVIDGPFQRLVEKKGLVEILILWARRREDFLDAYERESARVEDLINRCLEHGIHGIVIADDMAGDTGLFLSPRDIERFSSLFYARAVSKIHAAHAAAFLHSCGRISAIVPQIISSGFDGLAGIQHRTNDLISLKSAQGSRLVVIGGIDGDLLEKEELSRHDIEGLKKTISALSRNGGFILSSSCGLYSGRFLERMERIYDLVLESRGGQASL
jgi:uroporphyrinogen-III decarboxylase